MITINDNEDDNNDDDDEYLGKRPDWEKDIFDKTKEVPTSDDYLELPSQFDIHEYQIMQEFCQSYPNEK